MVENTLETLIGGKAIHGEMGKQEIHLWRFSVKTPFSKYLSSSLKQSQR